LKYTDKYTKVLALNERGERYYCPTREEVLNEIGQPTYGVTVAVTIPARSEARE
jgi:hypothetical protein